MPTLRGVALHKGHSVLSFFTKATLQGLQKCLPQQVVVNGCIKVFQHTGQTQSKEGGSTKVI